MPYLFAIRAIRDTLGLVLPILSNTANRLEEDTASAHLICQKQSGSSRGVLRENQTGQSIFSLVLSNEMKTPCPLVEGMRKMSIRRLESRKYAP